MTEEAEKEFFRLCANRKQSRRLATIAYNAVIELFDLDENGKPTVYPSEDDFDAKYVMANDRFDRLFELDAQVSDVIFHTNLTDMEIDADFDSTAAYRDKWLDLSQRKTKLFKVEVEPSEAGSQCTVIGKKSRCLKLFKLEPKKYDGSLQGWIGFWAMYKTVHEDKDLDPEEKFLYLLQLTKEGSPARELLDSFPPSAENYPKAIETLTKRFGRTDMLVELYVRELLKLVLIQATGSAKLSLSSLYDRLETQLRALESLGVVKDNFSNMLLPLVESSLPDNILRHWERERTSKAYQEVADGFKGRLEELLTFLCKEVEIEERLALARGTFSGMDSSCVNNPKTKSTKKDSSKQNPTSSTPTAASLVNVKASPNGKVSCIFCSNAHSSENCLKAHDLSSEDVKEKLQQNGHCFLFFRKGQCRNKCKAFVKCVICGLKHNPLLCSNRKINAKLTSSEPIKIDNNMSATNYSPVLLQTLKVKLRGENETFARVLIDCGSQRSYATSRIIKLVGYKPLRQETLVHALFGGSASTPQIHHCFKIRLSSLNDNYHCNFDVLDTGTICHAIPGPPQGPWLTELKQKGIQLSDQGEGSVDVLIGADIAGKIWTGRRVVLNSGLIAMETVLGWTLMGKLTETGSSYQSNVSMLCLDAAASDLWRVDILGIEDPVEKSSHHQRDLAAKEHFLRTVKVLNDGRYEVQLPWVEDHAPLPINFEIATKRLESTIRKLRSTDSVSDYNDVFCEWLRDGIIEEVPVFEWKTGHYLPHRPVFKEGSTTRIRPVFDASCRAKGFPSLNQCLETGMNLIEQIPSILLRFRLDSIGIIADIKKAFLQLSVAPADRDFLRFLWVKEDGKKQILRHKRVVFGVSSSPFLLGVVIEHHLKKFEEFSKMAVKPYSPDIFPQLRRSFYVDNVVSGVSCLEDARDFISQSTSIFAEACFELRGWEYSDPSLLESTNTAVLGLIWDRKMDTLAINVGAFEAFQTDHVTRRTILSATQRIFDPIGVASPATLVPKLLVQQTWTGGGDWDSEVDDDTRRRFIQWIDEVHFLKIIKLNRCLFHYRSEDVELSLHTFCDASQAAYATVVFLRVERMGDVFIHLVGARSRVAPLKKTTIPRLELLAATLGARLACNVQNELSVPKSFYWSDSSTVIAWIHRQEPWNIFVFNRVSEIRKLSERNSWFHVPGICNPADLLSRGCGPKQLAESSWWEGPPWLKLPSSEWPMHIPDCFDEEEVMGERKKTAVVALVQDSSVFCSAVLSYRFTRYYQITRVFAWIIRFLFNRFSKKEKFSGPLTVSELARAEKVLLKVIQDESFDGIKDRKLLKLKPRIDSAGLIRLRAKIWARKDSEDFRAPFILPPDHVLVESLIMDTHIRHGHIIGQGLLSALRERYWIVRGRRAVKLITSKCVKCQRVIAKSLDVETPPLPENRVRDAHVFEVTGTDFAGPLYLKNGEKVWLCVFTCAIYRAVYFDVVTSLSTEAFMLAFRRFIARVGRPALVYSDNGTNFRGLSNTLSTIDWNEVVTISSIDRIEWRFNPPSAPWWGGFWERIVGILKVHLKKILGRASLTLDELSTVVCECAAFINSRPITYVSDDPSDPVPITPQMFLSDVRETGVPDFENIDSSSIERRIRRRNETKENLRLRFRTEYLGQLKLTMKSCRNTRRPMVGELVLVGSDNKKRIDWPLAIMEELITSPDGNCRVVKLRTTDGVLIRPIQKIYPLEIPLMEDSRMEESADAITAGNSEDPDEDGRTTQTVNYSEDDVQASDKNVPKKIVRDVETRCGRKVKLPVRFCD